MVPPAAETAPAWKASRVLLAREQPEVVPRELAVACRRAAALGETREQETHQSRLPTAHCAASKGARLERGPAEQPSLPAGSH